MQEITFADRLRYRFDNLMSRGTVALIGWLFLLSLVLIVLVSILVMIFGEKPEGHESFLDVMWFSLMHTIDAGTIAGDGTDKLTFLALMVVATSGGIFIFSALIGLLTSGIESKLDDLRKGRSLVVENDHIIILGWSAQIFAVIGELIIANENRKDACIAILAEKDKVEMEDEIRARIPKTGKVRIVCRTGSPIDLSDLSIINPNTSRSIIVLSNEADDPDAHVIKTILAITNNPHRRQHPYHIVAEISDPQNLEVARMIAKNEAKVLPVSELISRIAVQTCRQSGLSVVYTELLDFGGSEIYFKDEPAVIGKTFGELQLAYETSTIIGVRTKSGQVQLHPSMDYKFEQGDSIIAIAEDDDKIILSGIAPKIDTEAIVTGSPRQQKPERTLILGWNRRGTMMINELNHYVAPNSEVMIVADVEGIEAIIQQECPTPNMRVTVQMGSTTHRRTLDELQPHTYDHIITLSYVDTLAPQDADARSLITLLHLRDISEKTGHNFSIVSEMLDVRNRELAEVTHADDFIVSDRLISLMLSQIAENKDLMDVLVDLFDTDGSELYLKPMGDYVQTGKSVNLYTAVEAARRRNEIAIGYRLQSQSNDVSKAYGVYVNPNKAQTLNFTEQDKLIVISDKE